MVVAYTEGEVGGYLLVVLHVLVYAATVGRLIAGELDVFVGPDYRATRFTVELRPVKRVVERFLTEELELYCDDIVDASERIWDLLDNYKEVVEALEDTNESLISHQQNDILYVLTIFSVVMLPLTFLTGVFGMNVHFPGFDTTSGFLASLTLFVVTIVGMISFFRWKKWL